MLSISRAVNTGGESNVHVHDISLTIDYISLRILFSENNYLRVSMCHIGPRSGKTLRF